MLYSLIHLALAKQLVLRRAGSWLDGNDYASMMISVGPDPREVRQRPLQPLVSASATNERLSRLDVEDWDRRKKELFSRKVRMEALDYSMSHLMVMVKDEIAIRMMDVMLPAKSSI